jgi:hypothetical protein
VTLYAWDETDPLLQAWQKVYPSTLKPVSDMSGDLMRIGHLHRQVVRRLQHGVRLGRVVRRLPGVVALVERLRVVDVVGAEHGALHLEPSYSMFTTFIPGGDDTRNVLMGYLSVDSDAGAEDGPA